jgi:hypothetical protein
MSSSSELSSSEINQSQGFYHDGNNELPEMPALPEPLAPSEVVVSPDETLWRKYSSHYEFPLSMLLALGIHVFAILCVLAFMTFGFHFKAHEMTVGTVGKGDLKGGDNPLAGGDLAGSPDPGQNQEKNIVFDLGPPSKINQPEIAPNPEPRLPDRRQFDDAAHNEPRGNNGNSPVPGRGRGRGTGTEVGTSIGSPNDGPKRWTINMQYDAPESFIEKLADLRIIVAARKLDGRFLIFDSLWQKPATIRELTSEEAVAEVKKMQRSFYVSTGRINCENFALGLNLSQAPAALYLFIPPDLEEALLQAELKHHKKTVDQIKQLRLVTTFDVKRTENGWDVKVIKADTNPNLKY